MVLSVSRLQNSRPGRKIYVSTWNAQRGQALNTLVSLSLQRFNLEPTRTIVGVCICEIFLVPLESSSKDWTNSVWYLAQSPLHTASAWCQAAAHSPRPPPGSSWSSPAGLKNLIIHKLFWFWFFYMPEIFGTQGWTTLVTAAPKSTLFHTRTGFSNLVYK